VLKLSDDLARAHAALEKISAVAVSAIGHVPVQSVLDAVVELANQRDAALLDAKGWRIVAREVADRLRIVMAQLADLAEIRVELGELADRAVAEARRGA